MANSPNSYTSNRENSAVDATIFSMTNDRSSSSPNEGGATMTTIAEQMLRSQLLYALSIKDKFMSSSQSHQENHGTNNNMGLLSIQPYSSKSKFNFPILNATDCATQSQPSDHTSWRIPIIDHNILNDHPTNTCIKAQGKRHFSPNSPFTNHNSFPIIHTKGPSIEDFFVKVELKGITTNGPNTVHPADVVIVAAPNLQGNDKKDCFGDDGDGRIRSLPCNGNGYMCPKCNKVLPTSQHFASHASTHYKHETKVQRIKRQMAKNRRRRNLCLQKMNEGLSLVPISFHVKDVVANAGQSSTQKFDNGRSVKVEAESDCLVNVPDLDAPPGFGGVRIKKES